MPRQQNSRSSPAPAPTQKVYAPPPKIWHAAPQTNMWQSVKDGIGLGAGSAIGHRIVGSFLGPSTPAATQGPSVPSVPPVPLPQPSMNPYSQQQVPYFASEHYIQCLEANAKNPELCRSFLTKDRSPWTQCMEMNYFRADLCSEEKQSKSQ